MKEDLGVKRSSLGMPMCTPNKYSRRLKRLSLGMPPCIPFFIKNYQFVPRCTIFLSLHALCAMLGASRSLLLLVCFSLFAVVTSQTPAFLCVGEKHAPLKLEHLIGFASYFLAVSCSLSFLSCCPIQLQCFRVSLKLLFCFRLELSIVCMFILFREFACCTESCVLTRKQVVEIAILFVVVICNSFEVLT